MASFIDRIQVIIDASSAGFVRETTTAADASTGLAKVTGKADDALGKMGITGVNTGAMLKGALVTGAAVGGAALLKFGADAIETELRYTGFAREFQRATGTSAETASRMVAVFDDLEISQDTAARGFFKLAREVGTGDTSLEKYGITVARTKDGNLDLERTMLRIAEAYKNATDQGDRAALIQEAFGRGGKELIPILEQGRAGIEKLFANVPEGQIFDQAELDQARKYELALDDLNDSMDELKMVAADELIPALTEVFGALATGVRTVTEARAAFDVLGDGIGGAVVDAAQDAINPMHQLTGTVSGLGKMFGIGGGESDKFADSQKRLAEAQKEVAKVSADTTSSDAELREAKKELRKAYDEFDGVQKRVVENLKTEKDKTDEAAAATLRKMDATEQSFSTELRALRSQQDLTAATAEANDKVRIATELGGENELANADAAIAQDELKEKILSVAAANEANTIKMAEAAGAADAATQGNEAYRNTLAFLAGQLEPGNPLRVYLEGLIGRLDAAGAPREANVKVKVDTTELDHAEIRLHNLREWATVPLELKVQIFSEIFG